MLHLSFQCQIILFFSYFIRERTNKGERNLIKKDRANIDGTAAGNRVLSCLGDSFSELLLNEFNRENGPKKGPLKREGPLCFDSLFDSK